MVGPALERGEIAVEGVKAPVIKEVQVTNAHTHQQDGTPRFSRWPALGFAGLGTAILVVAVLVNLESATAVVFADLLLVALVCVAVIRFGWGRLPRWMPWIAVGALTGAALMTVLNVAPWPLAAALAFVAAGLFGTGGKRPRIAARIGIVALSAALNATLLWTLLFSEHRPVCIDEYNSMDLRVHTLLTDVPLRDVWVARLSGGPREATMQDLRWLLVDGFRHNLNTAFVAVAGTRELLGSVFSWDDHACEHPEASVVHWLTEADRNRSSAEPGDGFVYVFEHEALLEITNCTVHALIAIALEPVEDGYDLYWAFYVERVAWITPFYMALIDPFRHTVVYPPIIDGIERAWAERWSSQSDRRSAQSDQIR
jgi:hypothetical protein